MPSTFVHAFLPSLGLYPLKSQFSQLTTREWLTLLFLSAVLGNALDWDIVPACFAGSDWKSIHRGLGHNVVSIGLWMILGQKLIQRFLGHKLNRQQGWALSFGLVASHIFLDAMQDVDPDGRIRGVPLFWPLSSWEFNLPFRLFKILKLKPDIHFLWAHITSEQFWTSAIFDEIKYSVCLWLLWFLIVRLSFQIFARPSTRAKTNATKIASLSERSSQQYNQVNPSPRPQGNNPPHKDTNYRSVS